MLIFYTSIGAVSAGSKSSLTIPGRELAMLELLIKPSLRKVTEFDAGDEKTMIQQLNLLSNPR